MQTGSLQQGEAKAVFTAALKVTDMMNKKRMGRFYADQIQYNFSSYWSKFVDAEYRGTSNYINNKGDSMLVENKFTWSQGRRLWILGKTYELNRKGAFSAVSEESLEMWTKGTWDPIKNHSIYGDSICCYVLTRDGQKKKDKRTGRYDASIYADCFVLTGMSQYVKTMGYREGPEMVEQLCRNIVRCIEARDFLTEPYPTPDGYETHGIPMILVNMVQEYILMRQSLNLPVEEETVYVRGKLEFILNELYDGKSHIRGHKSTPERYQGYMLDRHLNPGHALEGVWFWVEFLETFGGLEEYLPETSEIAKKTSAVGWDEEYGGLLRFVDSEGDRPRGINIGSAYERLMEGTWDMKLWWSHLEMLYLLPRIYELTGDESFLQAYEKSFTYAFTTFPNQELGERIQIRRRDGSPEEKLVALPVKDPFHIMRSLLKNVESCL